MPKLPWGYGKSQKRGFTTLSIMDGTGRVIMEKKVMGQANPEDEANFNLACRAVNAYGKMYIDADSQRRCNHCGDILQDDGQCPGLCTPPERD